MDCASLYTDLLFPHMVTSSSFRRLLETPRGIGIGADLFKHRLLSPTCWAIGGGSASDESFLKGSENGSLLGAFDESASAPFLTLDAEITPETIDFFVSDAEGDPDCPTEGYSSIEQALNTLREGKFVIVVDDENGDIEGNLIMAASLTSPQHVSFLIKNGSGIVSVGMKEEDLERLKLPLMSPETENEDSSAPTFTITVDAKSGTCTGVSASDRAKTVLALSSPETKPEDFRRPGHVFPLKYRNGGVLRRAGHTEASVDLVMLAGLPPVSVLSAIIDPEDGSIASLADIRKLAMEHNIPIVSITDLIRYRRKREYLVERSAISRLPTKWGLFEAYCYRSKLEGTEHLAIVKGNIGDGQDVLVRVHSECLTGDIFGSARCDCGNQLDLAMQLIEQAGRGIVVYLRGHEGRGIGLGHKLRAYNLQDQGHDTVQANIELGLAVDAREYGIGAQILRDIGVRTMRLMTNNPAKFTGLKGYGLAVIGRVPVFTPITEENKSTLCRDRVKLSSQESGEKLIDSAKIIQVNAVERPDGVIHGIERLLIPRSVQQDFNNRRSLQSISAVKPEGAPEVDPRTHRLKKPAPPAKPGSAPVLPIYDAMAPGPSLAPAPAPGPGGPHHHFNGEKQVKDFIETLLLYGGYNEMADILVNLTSLATEMGRLVSEGYVLTVLAPNDEAMAKLTTDQLSEPGAPEQIIYGLNIEASKKPKKN